VVHDYERRVYEKLVGANGPLVRETHLTSRPRPLRFPYASFTTIAPGTCQSSDADSCRRWHGCRPTNQTEGYLPRMNRILRWLTMGLVVLALAACVGLLASDSRAVNALGLSASAISAAPLLLVGMSFLIVQTMIRPRLLELLRNMLLVAAFILWGVVQLMAQSVLSKRLGNVVIALYVMDLAWVILARVNPTGQRLD
jgi:hypothetical protein